MHSIAYEKIVEEIFDTIEVATRLIKITKRKEKNKIIIIIIEGKSARRLSIPNKKMRKENNLTYKIELN